MYSEVVSAEDLDIAARTVWGEARGEPFDGKVAVAQVIVNRAEKGGWWGDTLKGVCRKDWQFSCWNHGDPNREKMESLGKDDPAYLQCLQAVAMALVGDGDLVGGACHYHTKAVTPGWIEGAEVTANIGNHIFYKGVK